MLKEMMEQADAAGRLLSKLGYYWHRGQWTNQPTAEQRLEAIREAVAGTGTPIPDDILDILSPTWRPGKMEGKP